MALVDTTTAVPSRELPDSLLRAAQEFFWNRAPVHLPMPHLHDATIENIHRGLFAFDMRATPDEKKRWCLEVSRRPGQGADDGFIDRSDETRAADRKVYFHFRPELTRLLKEHGVTVIDPWRSWLDECKHAYDVLQGSLREFAAALDHIEPRHHFLERVMEAELQPNSSVLRILKYHAGSSGHAAAHFDQTCISMPVRSSEPSLYFERECERVLFREPSTHEALAFPGRAMERITDGTVRATKHGTDPSQRREHRWAIVFFGTAAE